MSLPYVGLMIFALACNKTEFQDSPSLKSKEEKPSAPKEVEVDPVPEEPSCEVLEKAFGLDILVLMDNSSSLRLQGTDCKNPVRGVCAEPTYREEAVLEAFDRLVGLSPSDPTTRLSVASFTPESFRQGHLEDLSQPIFFSFEAREENRAELARNLEFTRTPKGDTPYMVAVEWAQKWLMDREGDERTPLIIMITDGLPTDRDPTRVKNLAKTLPTPIELLIVNRTEQTIPELWPTHLAFLQANYGLEWPEDGVYQDFDDYFSELKTVPEAIGNGRWVELNSAQDLPQRLFEQIIESQEFCQG